MKTKVTDRISPESMEAGSSPPVKGEFIKPPQDGGQFSSPEDLENPASEEADVRMRLDKSDGEFYRLSVTLGATWRNLLRWSILAVLGTSLLVRSKEILAGVEMIITTVTGRGG
jgi:hypothetical protein